MAGKVGLRALGKIATHEGEDAVAHVAEHEEADVAERGAEREAEHAAESCALSFAPNTLVTTPSGLRFIASLKVGDKVSAYDPATGKASVQTVQHTFINHDTNLLSVTLRTVSPASASQGTTGSAVKQRDAAVAAHGAHAPPQTPADETIQTTTNHPWLTADHGWILASFLHVGEPVQRVDGSTALVIAVRSEPGAAAMWDLTVSNVHTFAVGGGAYVVHNCGPVNDPELRGLAQKAYRQIGRASDDWKMTVAVADVQDGAGATRRLVSVNESLLGRVGREAVASSVHVVFGDSAELFTDAVDRFGFSEGYGHAEGYIKGYLESNPGSTLQRIGVSHPGGFCAACFRGLGG